MVNIGALSYLLIVLNLLFISFLSRYLFRKFVLNTFSINPYGNDLVLAFYTIVRSCVLVS